ncbi:hypothetical protein TRVA0_041S00672 [Trichomonascus vanleenenianus]|uniref:Rco1p n=1 Tax=Trichomonascus vanleenenianus TaxID=2268995 RepID=UPI003ECA61CD
MVTGYPIDTPPPAKLLKQSVKSSRSVTNSDHNSPAGPGLSETEQNSSDQSRPPSPPLTSSQEGSFKIKLKTNLFNTIVKNSNVRDDEAVRRSRRVTDPVDYYKPQEGLELEEKELAKKPEEPPVKIRKKPGPKPGSKRRGRKPNKPKNEEPVATPNGAEEDLNRSRSGSDEEAKKKNEKMENMVNIDYCAACGGVGNFVCCEGCPNSFHFFCTDPPVDEENLPDEWYCRKCYVKKHPPLPHKKGIWSQLLDDMDRINPVQFALPKDLQIRYEGVIPASDGEYEVESRPPNKETAIVRDLDDPLKVLDKNGDPILCHRCKKSALNGVQVLTCDYCPLAFHVDCVTPPVLQAGTKWRCPNHSDQGVKLARRPRKVKYEDPTLQRRFKNNGHIEVINDEDEDEGQFQKIPSLFDDVKNTATGFSSKVKNPVLKQRLMFGMDDVVYRLPEESIKLDFIESVRDECYEDPYPLMDTTKVLMALDELALRSSDVKDAVRNLSYFQLNGSPAADSALARANMSVLVDAALAPLSRQKELHHGSVKKESAEQHDLPATRRKRKRSEVDEDSDLDEYDQLLAIKQLMQLKGKEKLLEFLYSDD